MKGTVIAIFTYIDPGATIDQLHSCVFYGFRSEYFSNLQEILVAGCAKLIESLNLLQS